MPRFGQQECPPPLSHRGALTRHNCPCRSAVSDRPRPETKMRKTFLTILAASLIVGSTMQIAAATEHYTHKSDRAQARASEQFRNAEDSLASPSVEQTKLVRLRRWPCDLGARRPMILCPMNMKSPTDRRGFFTQVRIRRRLIRPTGRVREAQRSTARIILCPLTGRLW